MVKTHRGSCHWKGSAPLSGSYELGGQPTRLRRYLVYAYGRTGQKEQARRYLDELDALAQHEQYVSPYFPALVLSGLEVHEGAFDRLERADADGDQTTRDYLKVDLPWDRMRSLPRFQALKASGSLRSQRAHMS